MSEKGENAPLPTHSRTLLIKYLAGGGPNLLRGEPVEVVRLDRSTVAGLLVLTGPEGVIVETGADEIAAIPLRDVRTVRRPRTPTPWPTRLCVTDCSACGAITLCRSTRDRRITA
ncbi:MAG TPA: hypothetical protein HA263_03020 [Methanoregulaceae archaeon]|nr:hypothetical protein [Methanoregulaceae archaeon]